MQNPDRSRESLEPLPWYKWFIKDYRASRRVQRMGYVARGLLRECLDEQWLTGYITGDIVKLAEIADCPEEVMRTEWPKLAPLFEEVEPGKLVNPKLERMRTQADAYRVNQARCGRRGGRPRKLSVPGKKAHDGTEKATLSDLNGTENQGDVEHRADENPAPDGASRSDDRRPHVRPEEYANVWNQLRGPLPKVQAVTESRRKKVKARMAQGVTLEAFAAAVRRCSTTPFLTGENSRGWRASFDFLTENDTNIAKVMEGKYDQSGNGGRAGRGFSKTDRTLEAAASVVRELAGNPVDRLGPGEAGDGEPGNLQALCLEARTLRQT